jgi:hypothetical protein
MSHIVLLSPLRTCPRGCCYLPTGPLKSSHDQPAEYYISTTTLLTCTRPSLILHFFLIAGMPGPADFEKDKLFRMADRADGLTRDIWEACGSPTTWLGQRASRLRQAREQRGVSPTCRPTSRRRRPVRRRAGAKTSRSRAPVRRATARGSARSRARSRRAGAGESPRRHPYRYGLCRGGAEGALCGCPADGKSVRGASPAAQHLPGRGLRRGACRCAHPATPVPPDHISPALLTWCSQLESTVFREYFDGSRSTQFNLAAAFASCILGLAGRRLGGSGAQNSARVYMRHISTPHILGKLIGSFLLSCERDYAACGARRVAL